MFEFNQEEYEDAVVMPGYRNIDQPQHFYVAEIRMDLNPASPFPSPELYKTFAEYYTTKYGLSITNYVQPLLDVDHTSARLNLLTPRYLNQKGVALPTSSAETKKARRENLQQKQILIPELCEVHVFPASLWRKAVCIPTILYRMNCLLVSEELRITISEGANIGQISVPENHIYEPLSFSFLKESENAVFALNKTNDDVQSKEQADGLPQSCASTDKSHSNEINGTGENGCESTSVMNGEASSQTETVKSESVQCETFQDVDKNVNKGNEETIEIVDMGGDDAQSDWLSHQPDILNGASNMCDEFNKLVLSKSENENNINKEIEEQMNSSIHRDEMGTMEYGNGVTNSDVDIFAEVGHFDDGSQCKKKEEEVEVTEEELDQLLSFDIDITTGPFIGPSPCMILQALTMSNANDFFSLERLETIGDSFLKYAITVYLYCTYPGVHEGKLSYLRSKQVSNCNLYRLGKKKGLAECMISTKFEPYENWLPPGYQINEEKRKGPVPKVLLATKVEKLHSSASTNNFCDSGVDSNGWDHSLTHFVKESEFTKELKEIQANVDEDDGAESTESLIPYCLQTLHSLPDKSIADCVESLIGCYLTSCGKKVALRFMSWLGLKVLPKTKTKGEVLIRI